MCVACVLAEHDHAQHGIATEYSTICLMPELEHTKQVGHYALSSLRACPLQSEVNDKIGGSFPCGDTGTPNLLTGAIQQACMPRGSCHSLDFCTHVTLGVPRLD